jgi:hypothetical protein
MSESPIRFLDVSAMAASPPPAVPWLAPPVLPRASLTGLYAPGGDGKSLFAAALCGGVGRGTEVAGIKCERGVAIYLDGENGEHEIWRRVHTLGLPTSGVLIADACGFDLRVNLGLLEDAIREHKPDLVVLDSFRSLTPGLDENDTKQTAGVLDALRHLFHTLGPAGLLIHHTNKSGKDFRGASSIRDACDVLWHLGRQDEDPDPRRRFLTCRKMRVAAEPERLWLRLEVDRGRVLIDQAEAPDGNAAATPMQPVRAKLTDEIMAALAGERTAASRSEVAERVGREPKDGSVGNALKGLVQDGLLSRSATGYSTVQTVQTPPIAPVAPFAPVVQEGAEASRGFAPNDGLDMALQGQSQDRVHGANGANPLRGAASLHQPDAVIAEVQTINSMPDPDARQRAWEKLEATQTTGSSQDV